MLLHVILWGVFIFDIYSKDVLSCERWFCVCVGTSMLPLILLSFSHLWNVSLKIWRVVKLPRLVHMFLQCVSILFLNMNLWWRYCTAFLFFSYFYSLLFLYYTLCMSFFYSEYSSILPFSSLADGWRWRWRWHRQYLFMLCNVHLFVFSD